MKNNNQPKHKQALRVVLSASIICAGLLSAWFVLPKPKASAAYTTTALLMVHGFSDTCSGAFETPDNTNSQPNDDDTAHFLVNHGWNSVVEVGYYNNDDTDPSTQHPYCASYSPTQGEGSGINIQSYSSTYCTQIPTSGNGTTDDSIRHLACLFAWYVYQSFTSQGTSVEVLAHSMGGLIVRDAIGESGQGSCDLSLQTCNGGFPYYRLDVPVVMTLATPHGGVYGEYYSLAKDIFGDPQELEDMNPNSTTSNFMHLITTTPSLEYPQGTGSNGTKWYLMAGSVHCNPASLSTGSITCDVEHHYQNGDFPDGDGIVQADSALSMKADKKILYGVGFCASCNQGYGVLYSADPNTQYSHEANTCFTVPLLIYDPFSGTWTSQTVQRCLSSPYYLNDATPGQNTKAWICQSACAAGANGIGGIDDVHVVDSNGVPMSGQSANFSLSEILSLLPPPPPPPPPTPTPTPTIAPGACPNHPNEANCNNQDYITQGCNAYPQSQVYNDSVVNMTLYYSTNCQANWTKATIVNSGYVLYSVSIQRVGTLAVAPMTLTDFPTNNMTVWHTRMLWAPTSPAISCVKYKNLSTNAVSTTYCTPASPVYTTCKNGPSEAHCNNQDSVQQGCNDYPQGTATSNGDITILLHWSTNCQANWGTASTLVSGLSLVKVVVNRQAVSGGLGAASFNAIPPYTAGASNYYSPMVWSPNNPAQACVYWVNNVTPTIYGPLCTGWH
jgi:hypothetical protein